MTRNKWEKEGVLENLLGLGLDLAYYMDDTVGVYHYVLVITNPDTGRIDERLERRLHWRANPDERKILDGVSREWAIANMARMNRDEREAFIFTYRGLRLLFPQLPQEP